MKQKRSISLFLCVTLLATALLTGCGSRRPDDSMIEADLHACLVEQFGDDFSFVSEEIISDNFFSGNTYYDDSYNISSLAVARGKYAEIEVLISANYTKHGQGWQNDYIDMNLTGFTIHTFPNESEISALVDARNNASTWDVTYTDFTTENNTLIGRGYVDASYNDFFGLKGDATTCWTYQLEENQWVIEQEYQDYYGVLTRNIEGSFKIHNGTVSRIHVRNQTETSMEILDTSEEEEWVKVDLITDGNNITEYSLQNGLTLSYVGYLADGEEVKVTLSDYNDLQITANYQYTMFDSWGFWETFIPAD